MISIFSLSPIERRCQSMDVGGFHQENESVVWLLWASALLYKLRLKYLKLLTFVRNHTSIKGTSFFKTPFSSS